MTRCQVIACAIMISGLALSVVVVSGEQQPVSAIPLLTAPPGASHVSGGGHGGTPARQPAELHPELQSSQWHWRLTTAMSAASIADHYTTQLLALGWTTVFKQAEERMSFARFSTGTPSEPLVGTLTVLTFAESGQAVVTVRIVRTRWSWRRPPGGQGASAAHKFTVRLPAMDDSSLILELPPTVVRVESGDAGGGPDFWESQFRLQTLGPPASLMTDLQSQLARVGWHVDASVRGPMLLVRRTTSPGGDWSEISTLMTFPGSAEIDGTVTAIRNRR